MAQGVPKERRNAVANEATVTALLDRSRLPFFWASSSSGRLGITESDFRIAGGLILFGLAALGHPRARRPRTMTRVSDFGVVPLGMPIIAGPAMLTALLTLVGPTGVGLWMTLIALLVNLLLVVVAFAYRRFVRADAGFADHAGSLQDHRVVACGHRSQPRTTGFGTHCEAEFLCKFCRRVAFRR